MLKYPLVADTTDRSEAVVLMCFLILCGFLVFISRRFMWSRVELLVFMFL